MAVCSEIHTKHINTVCGQNVELLNVKLVVHKVIIRLYKYKITKRTGMVKYTISVINIILMISLTNCSLQPASLYIRVGAAI